MGFAKPAAQVLGLRVSSIGAPLWPMPWFVSGSKEQQPKNELLAVWGWDGSLPSFRVMATSQRMGGLWGFRVYTVFRVLYPLPGSCADDSAASIHDHALSLLSEIL